MSITTHQIETIRCHNSLTIKLKRLTVPNIGDAMEQVEHASIAGKSVKWDNFGNLFHNFLRWQHTISYKDMF
jgi:hypothetical protein